MLTLYSRNLIKAQLPTLLRYSSTSASTSTPTQTPPKKSLLDISTKVLTNSEVDARDDKKFISHHMFKHPWFTDDECEAIRYEHREPKTLGDTIAFRWIQFFRASFDFVTGYKKPKNHQEVEDGFKGTRYEMTENKWMTRVIFLESVAGVPGSVAGFLRHLHSLRLLKRDKAWVETLLDEAYNERMHLLTFIKLGQPSWFTRSIIYVGQGVFCNLFFLFYLANPKYCHRFVGYLEEEAVSTYSHLIEELDLGKLPGLADMKAPKIAVEYWPELTDESKFRDLILRIRADEAKHREVNHTLANLDQKNDRNPFALQVKTDKPQPENGLKTTKGTGWERDSLIL